MIQFPVNCQQCWPHWGPQDKPILSVSIEFYWPTFPRDWQLTVWWVMRMEFCWYSGFPFIAGQFSNRHPVTYPWGSDMGCLFMRSMTYLCSKINIAEVYETLSYIGSCYDETVSCSNSMWKKVQEGSISCLQIYICIRLSNMKTIFQSNQSYIPLRNI